MQYDLLFQLNEAYRHEVYAEETLSEAELADINGWVSQLISEGYDLDDYSDEELYEAYLSVLDEAGRLHSSSDQQVGFARIKSNEAGFRGKKPMSDEEIAAQPGGQAFLDRIKKAKKSMKMSEQLDLYDIISEYLVSEGFCDSYEDADVIMANMSEEWRESIVEEVLDEAKGTILSVTSPKGEKRRARFDPIDRFVTPYYNLEKSQLKRATQQAKNERELERLNTARKRNLHRATHRSERGYPEEQENVQSGRQRLARRAKGL